MNMTWEGLNWGLMGKRGDVVDKLRFPRMGKRGATKQFTSRMGKRTTNEKLKYRRMGKGTQEQVKISQGKDLQLKYANISFK